jgi:uncharacterized protein YxeA
MMKMKTIEVIIIIIIIIIIITILILYGIDGGTLYHSWLRHYVTIRKIGGSSPDKVDFFN